MGDILIVDDERDIRELISDILKDEDPEHTANLDEEEEVADNLKSYERKTIWAKPNFKERVHNTVKKCIYNHSIDNSVSEDSGSSLEQE